MALYQARNPAPAYALKFWRLAQGFNSNDTFDRSGFRGIERQIWTIARSTGVDFEDLCQETFMLCAEKFSTYQKNKSALNTWIRWQARQAALRLSRQGTKHSIVDGEQATVVMEESVSPDVFTSEEAGARKDAGSGTSNHQQDVRESILESYDESAWDTNLILETRLSNGKTVRELAQFLLIGKAKGIKEAAKTWGCSTKEVLKLLEEARGELST